MTQIMTPSTKGQIDKAVANYRAMLEKHQGDWSADAVQTVLGQPELAGEQFAVFRSRVEAVSRIIVHKVVVNRSHTPQESLEAGGRRQYMNQNVVDTMPRGGGDEVELVYFKPRPEAYVNGWLSPANLRAEYEYFGLVPDPLAQICDNAIKPAFGYTTPNACQWQDIDENFCCAAFARFRGRRSVRVSRSDDGWFEGWLFAGVSIRTSTSTT